MPHAARDRSTSVSQLGHSTKSVLGKTRAIIDALAAAEAPLPLGELARRSGVAKPTVHRVCGELTAWRLVSKNEAGYQLGLRAFEIGHSVPFVTKLLTAARPQMGRLCAGLSETVQLSVLDGRSVLFLESITPEGRKAPPSRPGSRLPLHCTASGKVLLAYSDMSLLKAITEDRLERMTQTSVTMPGLLCRQVRRARRDGFALAREEAVTGFSSIAVPVLSRSKPTVCVAALSITVSSLGPSPERFAQNLRWSSAKITETARFGR